MLLREYAITPDVFDVTAYSSGEMCGVHIERLREVMLTEGLVRDLRGGEWRRFFDTDGREWHRRGKELVKKLATQGRLVRTVSSVGSAPGDDHGWCAEALASHREREFSGGVIVTERTKAAFSDDEIVAQVDRLQRAPWWSSRSPSVRTPRTLDAYREHLAPVLRCANSIFFIDPYLDPARGGYGGFSRLLQGIGRRRPLPEIEIHRVCWEEARDKRLLPAFRERIEESFRTALEAIARDLSLQVAVFLWDDFHDRYVISNLVGISIPHGLDTTTNPNAVTTWTRLGRQDRDDVQREFDPASGRHRLVDRFEIP